jgi:hypothetical protein
MRLLLWLKFSLNVISEVNHVEIKIKCDCCYGHIKAMMDGTVTCGWHDAGIHHTQSLYPFHLQPTVHHSLREHKN